MAVIRWNDPFRELATLQDRMNRIFEDTLTRSSGRRDEDALSGSWTPPVDIVETKDRLVLKAELPGFTEEQIVVRFDDGILSIEGERKFEKESEDEKYHCVERSYGRFGRSFRLPANVDAERINASFQNGLLSIELPKKDEALPKRIRIQATATAPSIEIKK